jgi:hypothetical protein
MKMDNAQQIFERILSDGPSWLIGQPEGPFLDFKRKEHPSVPGAERKDRQVYAELLSAFSNTGGGVIVWGGDCRKDSDGRDVCSGFKPISDLTRFLTDLNSNLHQALAPANPGITNHAIPLADEGDDSGLVITFVPESELTPHMALNGVDRYFMRSGDSSLVIPHQILADMFGRRQRPKLEPIYRFIEQSRSSSSITVSVQIGIRNIGRYVAKLPALHIVASKGRSFKYNCPLPPSDGDRDWEIRNASHSSLNGSFVWSSAGDVFIHPYTSIETCSLYKTFSWDYLKFKTTPYTLLFSARVTLFAEGIQPSEHDISLTVDDLHLQLNV